MGGLADQPRFGSAYSHHRRLKGAGQDVVDATDGALGNGSGGAGGARTHDRRSLVPSFWRFVSSFHAAFPRRAARLVEPTAVTQRSDRDLRSTDAHPTGWSEEVRVEVRILHGEATKSYVSNVEGDPPALATIGV